MVITDLHPDQVALGSVPSVRTTEGRAARISSFRHPLGDYIRGALSCGFEVLRCEETFPPVAERADSPQSMDVGEWDVWPWSLRDLVPDATAAVFADVPALLILKLQKRADDAR